MRVKITISYDGSRFNGFQIQKGLVLTVSSVLQNAFKSLKIDSKFYASGRTDAGVHALNQTIHIDLPPYWDDLEKLKNLLIIRVLPHIYLKTIKPVDKNFHARFDAKKRVYRYIISCATPNPFLFPYVTFVKSIDEKLINEAIRTFEGTHNFEYFKKSGSDVKNFIRTIYKTNFYAYKEYYIFYFEANGFLRSQIRIMVDFLLKISDKKLSIDDLKRQLNKKKQLNTTLAPPNGLYLTKIKY